MRDSADVGLAVDKMVKYYKAQDFKMALHVSIDGNKFV